MKLPIVLTVNGDDYPIAVYPTTTLVDALREEVGLTGTKKGCAAGECGACTVLLDGDPVASCMTLAVQAVGHNITTIEGLSKNGVPDPLQQSFMERGAIQCGYCTPGFIMVARALLDRNSDPTEEEVREAISGNLCRCTGYQKIVEAILDTARRMREGGD